MCAFMPSSTCRSGGSAVACSSAAANATFQGPEGTSPRWSASIRATSSSITPNSLTADSLPSADGRVHYLTPSRMAPRREMLASSTSPVRIGPISLPRWGSPPAGSSGRLRRRGGRRDGTRPFGPVGERLEQADAGFGGHLIGGLAAAPTTFQAGAACGRRQAELGGAVASDDLGIPGNLLLTSSPLGATRTMQPVQAPAANRLADVGRPPDRPSARGAGRAAGGLITDGDTQWMTVGGRIVIL